MLGELDDSFHDDDAAFTEVSDLLETRQNLVARDVDFLEVRTQSN
jgi:hypothetical protein